MASLFDGITRWLGERLSRYLSQTHHTHSLAAPTEPNKLMACLQPGDVLLVEGQSRFSVAIKYLTQSTWSHAALYVGKAGGQADAEGRPLCFLEADLREGVRLVGVKEFAGLHSRVCRPVGLNEDEIQALVSHALARLGQQYDLKNVIDLARYLLPTPPVPLRWRRQMLALGSGDPHAGHLLHAHRPGLPVGALPDTAAHREPAVHQPDVSRLPGRDPARAPPQPICTRATSTFRPTSP